MKYLFKILVFSIIFFSCKGKSDDTIRYIPDYEKDYSQIELKLLEEALANDADNEDLLFKRAKLYLKLKEYEKALIDINKAIIEEDENPNFYLVKSKILMSLQKYEEALQILKVAEKHNAESVELNLNRAEIYMNLNKYRFALDKVNRAQRLLPSDFRVYLLKGKIYSQLGDTAKSIENFKLAILKRKDDPESYQYLAEVYALNNRLNDAMNHVKIGLGFNPNNAFLNFRKGDVFEKMGIRDSAKIYYQTAVDLDPAMFWAEYKLGLWYMDAGKYEAAEPYFQKVVKYTNDLPKASYYLGLCYWYTGKYDYAVKVLEQVVKTDTANKDAAFQLHKIKTKLRIVTDSNIVAFKRQDSLHKAKELRKNQVVE